jgi:hypothetical protein
MDLGQRFHRLVQQTFLGIPLESISASINDPELTAWWNQFLEHTPVNSLPLKRYPEYILQETFRDYRLTAKFDLIAIEPGGQGVILDWKTSVRKPSRAYLSHRMQTRVYPYLLAKAGDILNDGSPLEPSNLQMIYWFTADPEKPEFFSYSSSQFDEDQNTIQALMDEILSLEEENFNPTQDERHCRFCVYRSYCDRGVTAGDLSQLEDDDLLSDDLSGFELDFDQVGEIAF